MPEEPEQLMGEELGPCVFCGRMIAYGINPDDGKPDSLIHEMPMCTKFQAMGPEEFIVAMREELERRQPS